MNADGELIFRVFTAALSMGYALQGRPNPFDIHESGRPKQADRPSAIDSLWNAIEVIKVGLDLRGEWPDQLLESLGHSSSPGWRRDALTKFIRAFKLTQKQQSAADQQALDLLGQVVWKMQEAKPEIYSVGEIKDVWPTRPSYTDSMKA